MTAVIMMIRAVRRVDWSEKFWQVAGGCHGGDELLFSCCFVAPSLGDLPLKDHAWYKWSVVSSIESKLELPKRQSLRLGEGHCCD